MSRIVVGGYDPSLAPDSLDASRPRRRRDRPWRRRHHVSRAGARAREPGAPLGDIAGLLVPRRRPASSGRRTRESARLDRGDIRPPNRAARALTGYTLIGRAVDVVETSRGCTFDCSFCSIIEMRGRNFLPFSDRARHRRHRRCARRAAPAASSWSTTTSRSTSSGSSRCATRSSPRGCTTWTISSRA